MVDVQTCPSLEDIAAFLDGRVNAEERARLIRHLADCPTCLEVLAGAAQFLAAEEAAAAAAAHEAGAGTEREPGTAVHTGADAPGSGPAAVPRAAPLLAPPAAPRQPPSGPPRQASPGAPSQAPPAAPLLPFRPGWRSRRSQASPSPEPGRRLKWLVAGLAAAALVTTVGVPGVMVWLSSRPLSSAELAQEVTGFPDEAGAQRQLGLLYREPAFRGGGGEPAPAGSSSARELMLGVDLLDFRIALEANDPKKSADKARSISARLGDFAPPEERKFYEDARLLENSHRSPRSLLAIADAHDRALEEANPGLRVGRFVEAARLAAANGKRDFFESRRHRHLLDSILADEQEPVGPDTREVLETLRQRVKRGDPADLNRIAVDLGQLLESTDHRTRGSE
jgi:hypothetical protein